MEKDVVKHFREWGIKQYNNDGKLFEKKSISNYHSSLINGDRHQWYH